jgi:copper homeostasis protein
MTLEICATNIQSAMIAEQAGAHRIELCTGLEVGGLTPSYGLIRAACHHLSIPVNVLIRPREGNFTYQAEEIEIMLDDIQFCKEIGAHGVVVGALNGEGSLDTPLLMEMMRVAGPMEVCCHRAFDYAKDPTEALEILIRLGMKRVLSSGQAATAEAGVMLLKEMVQQAAGRIGIMPGAGITLANIGFIANATGAREFHCTGKAKVQQNSPQGDIPGLEWWYWESKVDIIQDILKVLNPN